MQINRDFKQKLQREAEQIAVPDRLDTAVVLSVQPMLRERRENMNKVDKRFKLKWKPVFAAILTLLVICGFAFGASLLFDVNQNGIHMQAYGDTTLKLTQISGEEVRQTLQEVRHQLEPGEMAVVYFEAFAKEKHQMFREVPGLGVSHPVAYPDWQQWEQIMLAETNAVQFVDHLGEDYTFVKGYKDDPHFSAVNVEGFEALEELQQEARSSGLSTAWKKVTASAFPVKVMTAEYGNGRNDILHLSTHLPVVEVDAIKMYTDGLDYEKVEVNGRELYYTKSTYFLSSTDIYQKVFWFAGTDEKPVIVNLGSESTEITKEELISLASGLVSN